VQLSKNRLQLWANVNVAKDMDMCTKVKQLGVKMQKQIVIGLRLFHDFITNFMFLKETHLKKEIFIRNHHYYLQCEKVLERVFLHILNINKFG
jgi:predicted transcriptional regulator